jgi:hypothetical protein
MSTVRPVRLAALALCNSASGRMSQMGQNPKARLTVARPLPPRADTTPFAELTTKRQRLPIGDAERSSAIRIAPAARAAAAGWQRRRDVRHTPPPVCPCTRGGRTPCSSAGYVPARPRCLVEGSTLLHARMVTAQFGLAWPWHRSNFDGARAVAAPQPDALAPFDRVGGMPDRNAMRSWAGSGRPERARLEARCRISPQEQVYCWVAVSEVTGHSPPSPPLSEARKLG